MFCARLLFFSLGLLLHISLSLRRFAQFANSRSALDRVTWAINLAFPCINILSSASYTICKFVFRMHKFVNSRLALTFPCKLLSLKCSTWEIGMIIIQPLRIGGHIEEKRGIWQTFPKERRISRLPLTLLVAAKSTAGSFALDRGFASYWSRAYNHLPHIQKPTFKDNIIWYKGWSCKCSALSKNVAHS